MGQRPGPGTRRLLRRDERRAQILREGAAAFARQGYAATSVDDVATQAGITKLIVYRHFESKAELYRAILDGVAHRLAEEWATVDVDDHGRGRAVTTLLTVARELPDGFRLLFVHAPREADFASVAGEFRELQHGVAEQLLADVVPAGPWRTWMVRMAVDYLVAAVLEWMEVGDPGDDEVWAARATAGLRAATSAWLPPSVAPPVLPDGSPSTPDG